MNTNKKGKTLFGHPAGLYVLFLTEFWERFSFYGMRALFTLFLVSETTSSNPGFGWSKGDAIWLYGWYTMLVYLASIPGGWIADRFLGRKKVVFIGGILLCIGHTVLMLNSPVSFYVGCLLIILGVGGLKANISSMVGSLYKAGDQKRDLGFYIFYIGINLGALIAPIFCGYLGEKINWHYGFGLAAVGMLIGQLVYYFGQRYLVGIGEFVKKDSSSKSMGHHKPLTRIEKDRIIVLLISFFLIILFFSAFEQAGGLMNLYALQKTDRMLLGWEVPASWFQSINSVFIITLGVVVGKFWLARKLKGKETSSLFKIAVGMLIMGWGFAFMRFASVEYDAQGSSGMHWLILAYLFHSIGELCVSPVSLSYVTKLAPAKYSASMMGVYFAAIGLGDKFAGDIGQLAIKAGETEIFTGIVVFCTLISVLIILILKPLKRLSHGAEDLKPVDLN